jgi:raffinose/stachyose/melibiose transport system permease protein
MTAQSPTQTYKKRKFDPVMVGLWISLLIVAFLWVMPSLFVVFTSLKSADDIYTRPAYALPTVLLWENYTEAWDEADLARSGLNSMLISFTKVPIGIFLGALAAYALSRMRFRYQKGIFLLITFGTLIPIQITLAPLFRLILDLGLINTYLGLLFPYIAFGVPYAVFIMYGFFKSIPRELDESAYIDGASHFRIFWSIVLPLSKPVLAALFILDFVATWNEFAMALVILHRQNTWTIPLSIMAFQGQFGATDYGPQNAAIVMTILPVLIVYLMFQRYFVSGIFAGAVKG